MSMVWPSESTSDKTVVVGGGNLKLFYTTDEGKLTRYINKRSLVEEFAQHSYSYYSGYNGTDQASGAYIFRPNGTFPIKYEGQKAFTILRGPLMDEVHQQLNSWIYQVTRIYKKEHAEVEFNVRDFRTDWDLQVNQPVAGNYYPINLGAYVGDESMELSVLVDHAVGGQIELMLHRRLLYDDSKGVGEVLNETVCILNDCNGLMVD